MALTRSVTKAMKRTDARSSTKPARAQSMRTPGVPIDRSTISLPVALVSTTNMLSYNAPDIATYRHASSSPSVASTHSDDSDHSTSSSRSRSSSHGPRDTFTDASSVEGSPALTDPSSVESSPTMTSPKPNHLSEYFESAKTVSESILQRPVSSGNLQARQSHVIEPVPAIPERALSHSKRAHERLAQKRSLQNMKTRTSLHSNRSSREHRASVDMFKATIEEESHPFGKELEQLNEIAEEFGGVVRDAEYDADVAVIQEKGLGIFCAADYLSEIQPLFSNTYGSPTSPSMAWI